MCNWCKKEQKTPKDLVWANEDEWFCRECAGDEEFDKKLDAGWDMDSWYKD